MTPLRRRPRHRHTFDDDRRSPLGAGLCHPDRPQAGALIERDCPRGSAERTGRAARRKGREGLRLVARDQGPAVGAARRARVPQLHRQALLHPVGIDDAGAADGRSAGGHQISLWLVLGVARASTSCRDVRAACSASLPERGDIVIVTPPGTRTDYIKRVIGLPGDTVRMVDGQLFINGQPVKRQPRPPVMIPVDVNSPCGSDKRSRRSPTSASRAPTARCYCRLPIVRETLPNGRTYDTVDLGRVARGQFRAGHRARRPCLPDGRQSRRFAPTAACPSGRAALAVRCRGRISAAAPSSSPSRSTASTSWWNPLTWFERFRPGRAGTSLRATADE